MIRRSSWRMVTAGKLRSPTICNPSLCTVKATRHASVQVLYLVQDLDATTAYIHGNSNLDFRHFWISMCAFVGEYGIENSWWRDNYPVWP